MPGKGRFLMTKKTVLQTQPKNEKKKKPSTVVTEHAFHIQADAQTTKDASSIHTSSAAHVNTKEDASNIVSIDNMKATWDNKWVNPKWLRTLVMKNI